MASRMYKVFLPAILACGMSSFASAQMSSSLSGYMPATTTSVSYMPQTYGVELNKTEIIQLPSRAGSVVIGNPNIADVSVHSDKVIFVIGRNYGETNIIILDQQGQVVMNADVQVLNSPSQHGVRVYNGANARRSYSCAPYCLPSPTLGDEPEFVTSNTVTAQPINNQVATSAPTNTFGQNGSISPSLNVGRTQNTPPTASPTISPSTY